MSKTISRGPIVIPSKWECLHSRVMLTFEAIRNHATFVTRGKCSSVDRVNRGTCPTKSGWDQMQQGHGDRVDGDHTDSSCVCPQGEVACREPSRKIQVLDSLYPIYVRDGSSTCHPAATGFRPLSPWLYMASFAPLCHQSGNRGLMKYPYSGLLCTNARSLLNHIQGLCRSDAHGGR